MKSNYVCLTLGLVLLLCGFALAQSGNSATNSTVSGEGTPGFVPVWRGPTTLGNSTIVETKTKLVGIGTKKPTAALEVQPPSLVVAVSADGANAPVGSNQNGGDGVRATGGAGDGDGQFGGDGLRGTGGGGSGGGAGIVGTGGAGFMGPGSDGAGLVGIGGGTSGDAVDGIPANGCTSCLAGDFFGDVVVSGTLTATTKHFRIDHPLDPVNKYLVHASVESSEMKNFYDGVVVLDNKGEAVVQLPDWFQAVNGSLRYQLTAIGASSPGLYIAQEVKANRFTIAGGAPGIKVSWQITGVRQDRFSQENPLVVEQPKSASERGYYVHPELYGAPEEQGIEWARHPRLMRAIHDLQAEQVATQMVPSAALSKGAVPGRNTSR